MMTRTCFFRFFVMLFCALNVMNVHGAEALNMIENVRVGQQQGGIRIVVDGSEKFNYDVFLLDNPNRLVVDVRNARMKGATSVKPDRIIKSFRAGEQSKISGQRLVFELNTNVDIKKKFLLEPDKNQSKWRLVIDLASMGGAPVRKEVAPSVQKTTVSNTPFAKRQKIVVLDPGHGGKDPGAIGRSYKTYEKNITLSMGKELKSLLERRGYKVYMTRSTDIFIPLRKRVAIARSYHADLFISVHADSTLNRNARGFSVYTLSEKASDKEAEALAERENKADIIDGMDFSGNSPEINDVLISLSQNDSRNKSSKFAGYVVSEVKKKVKTINDAHRFAGFAVLKAPDIPSVLLEMGYLSNYTEERYLRDPSYRRNLAQSLVAAVDRYFKDPEVASAL